MTLTIGLVNSLADCNLYLLFWNCPLYSTQCNVLCCNVQCVAMCCWCLDHNSRLCCKEIKFEDRMFHIDHIDHFSLLTHLFVYLVTITDYFWTKYADYLWRLHTSIANWTIFPGFLFHLDEIFRLHWPFFQFWKSSLRKRWAQLSSSSKLCLSCSW